MKFTALRRYINSKDLSLPHILENCNLVIDGDSFFRDTYKHSECQFILGPDSDRYANFIKNKLSAFLDNHVKCFVIFSGATKHDINKTKEIHQSIIDNRNEIVPIDMVGYFQPLLVKDVQKEVLEDMGIKYFVCEYDSIEAIVGVARKFKCPVLTNNVEYSCFGVSCISPNSVEYDKDKGVTKLNCKIYEHERVKTAFGVYNKMPMLLALLNESGDYSKNLGDDLSPESTMFLNGDRNVIWPVIRCVKRQKEATLVSLNNEVFKNVYEKIKTLYLYPLCNLAVKYFQRDRAHGLFKDDKKWFAKGVSNGRIAPPYINLMKKGEICGSSLMYDSKRPDALLVALDIIVYTHCLLKNSQDSTINFLGRKGNKSYVTEINTHWNTNVSNRDIFTKHRVGKKFKLITGETETFQRFLEKVLPGYHYNNPLEAVPEDCRILIITLVYYVFKKNKDFINGAYCILLSYLMLGPVSNVVDSFKKNGQSLSVSNNAKDAVAFYNGLQFLFDKVNLKQKYNSTVFHNFSEFQHCLQHMNYLNKLCGEKFPNTVYHKTYNATFIYNTFLFIDNKDKLMQFLENKFGGSIFLKQFQNIVSAFKNCLSAVKIFADINIINNSDSEYSDG